MNSFNFWLIEVPSKRNFGLDLLRSIAIAFVLVSHSLAYLPVNAHDLIRGFLIDGVAVFFVLSGFLIGSIMLKSFQKEINLRLLFNFWIKRWFRTLPLYFIILAVLSTINSLSPTGDPKIPIHRYLLFIQNFYRGIYDFFPESWSLSVEEWFYLLFPICLLGTSALVKSKKLLFLLVICTAISAVTLLRAYKYFHLETKSYYVYDRLFLREVTSRLDAIVYGVFGAWVRFYLPAWWMYLTRKRIFLLLVGVVLVYGITHLEKQNDIILYVISFGVTSAGVLFTLPFFTSLQTCRFRRLSRTVTTFSIISYSMYLINLNLISYYILSRLHYSNTIKFFLFWFLTLLLSLLLYKYIEKPITDLREKLVPKNTL